MSTRILVLVVLLMCSAPPAEARHRMTFRFATSVAVDYWAKHDVSIPCRPTRVLLSAEEKDTLEAHYGFGIDMAANRTDCEVLITPAAEYYRVDRVSRLQWLYCTDVVHELGHLAGLDHEDGGAMDPTRRGELVPWGCDHPHRFLRQRQTFRTGLDVANV